MNSILLDVISWRNRENPRKGGSDTAYRRGAIMERKTKGNGNGRVSDFLPNLGPGQVICGKSQGGDGNELLLSQIK